MPARVLRSTGSGRRPVEDIHTSLTPLATAEAKLVRRAEQAHRDLDALAHPAAAWVRPVAGPGGEPVAEVVIVGAGQAGLVVGLALKREGVRKIVLLDRNPSGCEGPCGPLNMPPGPQGRPVICQAGGSPAGRNFASKHADTIIARVRGVAAAKACRADISARMSEYGRDPDTCKVLFSTSIVLGETLPEAQEKKERLTAGLATNMDARLGALSFLSGMDFSKFDLDEPLPEVKTNASRSLTELYTSGTGKETLRQMLLDPGSGGIDFVGTPDSVAAEMGEAMQEIGGDGFLMTENLTRRTISEIADGLAPALKRRKLVRSSYSHEYFRDNLLAF